MKLGQEILGHPLGHKSSFCRVRPKEWPDFSAAVEFDYFVGAALVVAFSAREEESKEKAKMVDVAQAKQSVGDKWDQTIIPTLQEYIRIPNQSPSFDPTNAHLTKAVNLLFGWVEDQKIPGAKAQVTTTL